MLYPLAPKFTSWLPVPSLCLMPVACDESLLRPTVPCKESNACCRLCQIVTSKAANVAGLCIHHCALAVLPLGTQRQAGVHPWIRRCMPFEAPFHCQNGKREWVDDIFNIYTVSTSHVILQCCVITRHHFVWQTAKALNW